MERLWTVMVIKMEKRSEFRWPSSNVSLTTYLLSYCLLKLQGKHTSSKYMIIREIVTAYKASSCLEFLTLIKDMNYFVPSSFT